MPSLHARQTKTYYPLLKLCLGLELIKAKDRIYPLSFKLLLAAGGDNDECTQQRRILESNEPWVRQSVNLSACERVGP